MKKIVFTGLLIAGILFAGSHAFAWFGHGPMGFRGDGNCSSRVNDEQRQQRHDQHLERMGVILDLTQEQKQQLQVLHQQRQEQKQQLHEQMQASRDKMHQAARTSNTFNEEEFRATAKQHADIKTQMMVEMAKSRQQMATILTPEQLEKAEQLMDMRGGRCGNSGEGKERGRFHTGGKGPRYSG